MRGEPMSRKATNHYDLNDMVKVEVTFTNENGNAANPTTVTMFYEKPDGTEIELVYGVSGEVMRPATGTYYINILADMPGLWHYRFEGDGLITSAAEWQFYVEESEFYD